MNGTLKLGLWLLSSAMLGFAGCSDDDASGGAPAQAGAAPGGNAQGQGGSASDGSVECAVLGELCHEADTGPGPAHDCHEVGHEGEGTQCLLAFADCARTCVPEGAGGSGAGIDPRCATLGELCHPVDDETGPLHECHEIGHDGDASACAAAFTDCASRCLAARESAEIPVGGAAGSSASAGGNAAGGATAAGNAGSAG
jgi:hypothetical protein